MSKFVGDFVGFFKSRNVYTRLIAIIFLVVGFVGLLGPFAKLSLSFGLNGPFDIELANYENVPVGSVSLSYFGEFNGLGGLEIFGQPLDSELIGGYSFLDLAKDPGIISDSLDSLVAGLDSLGWLDSLSNFGFGESLLNFIDGARSVLVGLGDLIDSGDSVINGLGKVVSVLQLGWFFVDLVIFGLFLVVFLSVVLLLIPKVPVVLPRVLVLLSLVFVLALGVYVLVLNGLVGSFIDRLVVELNGVVSGYFSELLGGLLGEYAYLLDFVDGLSFDFLSLSVWLSLGWGFFVSVLGLFGGFISSFFVPNAKAVEPVK